MLQLIVGFGAVVAALCLDARTVNALDAHAATPNGAWCVETTEGSGALDCTYDSYLVCAVAAIRDSGLCKAAETVVASHPRPAASPRRSAPVTHASRTGDSPLTVTQREKLFREFVEWKRRSDQ
jgi:hypothetical protein